MRLALQMIFHWLSTIEYDRPHCFGSQLAIKTTRKKLYSFIYPSTSSFRITFHLISPLPLFLPSQSSSLSLLLFLSLPLSLPFPFLLYLLPLLLSIRNVRWRQPKMSSMATQVDAFEIDSFHLPKDLPKSGANRIYRGANDENDDADDSCPFLRINGSIPNSGFSG